MSGWGLATDELQLVVELEFLPLVEIVSSRRRVQLGRELVGAVRPSTLLECLNHGTNCKFPLFNYLACHFVLLTEAVSSLVFC